MKFSIPKIRLASSVGIYLADHEISWCALEKGAFGVQQFQAGERPSTKQDWAVELHKVLEPLATEFGPSAAVVIGLPANHAFFATLPVEGGKTGTAEVHGAQSHAWFVGYAPYGPAEKRVAFAVLIENAGYGGAAAAPAAGEIVTAAAVSGLIR